MGSSVVPCGGYAYCNQWGLWASSSEEMSIPKDVPKGYLVMYVGENYKRFVIKITLLKHPLFQALLDQTQDVYDFTADSCKRTFSLMSFTVLPLLRTKGPVCISSNTSVGDN